jgi:hypothetical protein
MNFERFLDDGSPAFVVQTEISEEECPLGLETLVTSSACGNENFNDEEPQSRLISRSKRGSGSRIY